MILFYILLVISGILLGYGLHSNIREVSRSIRYHLWAFWNYKIMKRPEPSPEEIIADLMPLAMMAGIMGSVVSSMHNIFGEEESKEKLQYITKKKSK